MSRMTLRLTNYFHVINVHCGIKSEHGVIVILMYVCMTGICMHSDETADSDAANTDTD